jgi:retinol-binding protein 3
MASSVPTASAADFPLQPDDVEAVIGALVAQLDSYVFPEVAEKIQADLDRRLDGGGYGDINGGQQLADTLTAQLQALSQDQNLRLHFSPVPLPHLKPQAEPTAEELERHGTRPAVAAISTSTRWNDCRGMWATFSFLASSRRSLPGMPWPPP